MVLVVKGYLDVVGHPSWGWRARHGSEMIQQILSIDAAALPAPAGFYWRAAGTSPAGGSGKSRLRV